MLSDRSSNTAILLFTRSEREEGRAKGFADKHGTSSGAAIARSFIHHTRAIGKRTGYPVVTVESGYQEGHDFGERLSHAFQKVFDRGYSNVIAIGNDTPNLKTRTLRSAARRMESGEHNVVLGPATDGGTYLIGLSRPAFDPELFRVIPWCSGKDMRPSLKGPVGTGPTCSFCPCSMMWMTTRICFAFSHICRGLYPVPWSGSWGVLPVAYPQGLPPNATGPTSIAIPFGGRPLLDPPFLSVLSFLPSPSRRTWTSFTGRGLSFRQPGECSGARRPGPKDPRSCSDISISCWSFYGI